MEGSAGRQCQKASGVATRAVWSSRAGGKYDGGVKVLRLWAWENGRVTKRELLDGRIWGGVRR